jgi:hypothetical protein
MLSPANAAGAMLSPAAITQSATTEGANTAFSRSNHLDEDVDCQAAHGYFFSFGVHSRMPAFLSVHSPTTDSTMHIQPAGPLTP